MIFIFVNIFNMNKKKLYEKTSSSTTTISSVTQIKIDQYLEILKVRDQTYLTISGVVIFKFV